MSDPVHIGGSVRAQSQMPRMRTTVTSLIQAIEGARQTTSRSVR